MNSEERILIASQNLFKYDIQMPLDVILRVNLAWCKNLSQVITILDKYHDYKIFLDIPIGRNKPPNYEHKFEDIAVIVKRFSNIEYVAISNIERANDLDRYQKLFKTAKIVPKIETVVGVFEAGEIIKALNYKPVVIMLDHHDLYFDLKKIGLEDEYLFYVEKLVEKCKAEKAHLIRTVGVVFSTWVD